MYNIFEYLKAMRTIRYNNNNIQTTQIHTSQCNSPVTAKNEPSEVDKPVPKKIVCF